MKKLYYATFEKGFNEIVKSVLKKIDKNSKIKKLYDDAVLFFADEHFKFQNSCFYSAYVVLHNSEKAGVGAINYEMKAVLQKRDFKINLPRDINSFKVNYLKENESVLIDGNLKNAFEVNLKKITKKFISFFAKDELTLLAKSDGENLFMRKLDTGVQFQKVATKYGLKPEVAYLMCFMSNPEPNEAFVDPFSDSGVISFVRSLSFHKANVIAVEESLEKVKEIKKLAKTLDEKIFSVLNYNFLEDRFPIKFIDKIVADLTEFSYGGAENAKAFFDKIANLKVKTIVVLTNRGFDIKKYMAERFTIETSVNAQKFNVYKLKIKS